MSLEALIMAKNELTFLPVLNYHTIIALGPKVGKLTSVTGTALTGFNYVTATHAK